MTISFCYKSVQLLRIVQVGYYSTYPSKIFPTSIKINVVQPLNQSSTDGSLNVHAYIYFLWPKYDVPYRREQSVRFFCAKRAFDEDHRLKVADKVQI